MKHTAPHSYDRHSADRARSGDEDGMDAELTPAEQEELGSRGADDTLGLYLRQMGSIPMLKRPAEIEVASRLERVRNRFRFASLRSGYVLNKAFHTDLIPLVQADPRWQLVYDDPQALVFTAR